MTVHIIQGSGTDFPQRLSKTRIKSRKSVALALDSSVSDGGIRAKIGKEPPYEDEVKIKLIKVAEKQIVGIILAMGDDFKETLKKAEKSK